jgi:hypothetical protein
MNAILSNACISAIITVLSVSFFGAFILQPIAERNKKNVRKSRSGEVK